MLVILATVYFTVRYGEWWLPLVPAAVGSIIHVAQGAHVVDAVSAAVLTAYVTFLLTRLAMAGIRWARASSSPA